MKAKKIFLATITIIMGFSIATASSYAGSKQQYRRDGAGISVSATIAGGAIVNGYARGSHVAPPVTVSLNTFEYSRPRGRHRDYYRPHKPYRCCIQHVRKQCRKSGHHRPKQWHHIAGDPRH